MRNLPLCVTAMLALVLFAVPANAGQTIAGPSLPGFSGGSVGGVGISVGGRGAVLSDGLFRSRSNDLVRVSPGSFLNVSRGRGGTPVVDRNSVLLRSSGTGFRSATSAGVFNPFFLPRSDRLYPTGWPAGETALQGWITIVAAFDDYPIDLWYSSEPIDQWVSQVFTLGDG